MHKPDVADVKSANVTSIRRVDAALPTNLPPEQAVIEPDERAKEARYLAHQNKPFSPGPDTPPKTPHSALPDVIARRAARKAIVRRNRHLR
jgi:hypothetical protein